MHPLPEDEDLNLICGMEDEMLTREVIIGYNRQTRREGCGSVERFSMECVHGDTVQANYFSYQDGFGVVNEHNMSNSPAGIIHYARNAKPWITPGAKMVYLPDDNYSGFGIIPSRQP